MIFDEANLITDQGINELPFQGQALSKHLLDLLNINPTPENLKPLKLELEKIFGQLPKVATEILTTYSSLLEKYNLDPGGLSLYMTGGRVNGKPLKEDTDIDLIIGVERSRQSAESSFEGHFPDPQQADQFKKTLQRKTLNEVERICKVKGIPNKFHILNFGAELEIAKHRNSSTSLLIGIYPKKIIPTNLRSK